MNLCDVKNAELSRNQEWEMVADQQEKISKLNVPNAEKPTLFHLNLKVIAQFFAEIALENKDRLNK